MAVGIVAQRGKAEFKIHYLDLGTCVPPVDSATFSHQDRTRNTSFTIQQHGRAEINIQLV